LKLTAVNAGDRFVRLAPLADDHHAGLAVAAADGALWTHWPRDMSGGYAAHIHWQQTEMAAGRFLFHTVLSPTGAVLGQTAYLNIRPEHAGVEIGHTWYVRGVQGGAVNPAAKRLLLSHAFACGVERVELKTDARNTRSRAAILKLGATFEGIHRRNMRRPDGAWRDTAWYSILAAEWPEIQAELEVRLAGFS
jgi:RimJ/RimL family protein N-acetyltransferase